MTFKTYVKNKTDGTPIEGLSVVANDEITGQSFMRSTDGGGYADVAMLGVPAGHRVTFVVTDPQLRFKGNVQGDALVTTEADQTLTIELDPFA